ncbi:hypothetical protein RJ639_012176 [Escallonia herrerae]|uniref:Agenet domain-containing protein n=1 Tax=Escallonia herrerae TaxID=1293975 RepID=A0AA88VNU2_9ASTE|nr:hypothetical protein RJ639_012176 [Escallonia herrerae]
MEHFPKGTEVEISSNEEGFRGSWYAGTVIRPPKPKNKVLVQYRTLTAGSRPLREVFDVVQLRPPPPRERRRSFEFSEEVDAYNRDGWWEGVVTRVLAGGRYAVYFRATREEMEFGESELRLHREWVKGSWVPPLEEEKVLNSTEVKSSIETVEEIFGKGAIVEISSDEDGFQGAWFGATVIEALSNSKFLIEYQSLRNDDDTELLKEEVDHLHIRPYPPDTLVIDQFSRHEEVDALYNDGWWVGVIAKVLKGQRYVVYFRGTNEEMEFKHSDLRLHQDWINGKWVMASRV